MYTVAQLKLINNLIPQVSLIHSNDRTTELRRWLLSRRSCTRRLDRRSGLQVTLRLSPGYVAEEGWADEGLVVSAGDPSVL